MLSEKYDYRYHVENDIRDYIEDHYTPEELREQSYGETEEKLYDEMFNADSVTGNGSGSYTFSTWAAEENLCHNLDLLGDALFEFGDDGTYIMRHGAEACDVTIRCYLLGEILHDILPEYLETE